MPPLGPTPFWPHSSLIRARTFSSYYIIGGQSGTYLDIRTRLCFGFLITIIIFLHICESNTLIYAQVEFPRER